MTNWYVSRDAVKDACGIAASTTGDHDQIDMTLESQCRAIDDWLGDHAYAQETTLYFTAVESGRLRLDRPLLSITALRTDSSGNASYGTTLATTQYLLTPRNAPSESPPQPYWGIRLLATSTGVFPSHTEDGVEIAGRFGWYDQRDTSTAVLSTAANATALRFEVTGATSLHPGQTIRIDSEDLFVERAGLSGSDTATTSGSVFVKRAQNGSSAAAHTSGAAIQIYRYPLVEQAALFQVQHSFKLSKAEPFAGGGGFGPTAPLPEGDLHPAVRRMLRGFKTPVVA